MQIKNQHKFNAEQNSINLALIPHVRIINILFFKLTCAAEINKTRFRLTSSHICSSVSTIHLKNKKDYLRDLLTYVYNCIAVLMVYTGY
jgi:hypothetical protein